MDKQKSKFNGFKIGATVKDKYRLGIGIYGMQNWLQLQDRKFDPQVYPEATDTNFFNFTYVSLFFQPIWYKTKRWDISTPLQLGIGTIELSLRETSGLDVVYLRESIPLTTFSVVPQYKVLRWFAVGVGLGYRKSLSSRWEIKNAVNAHFWNVQFKLLIGEVYKMVFKRKQLEEW